MENHVAVRLDISSEARGFRGKFRKDCHHSVAGLLQSFDHGDDGHETYTVATADHSTVVSDLERLSQRTEHITNPVIFVERTDQVGQTGTLVDYNGECAVGGRGIDDSKRDAGAIRSETYHHEMTGTGRAGDRRVFYHHLGRVFRMPDYFPDYIHIFSQDF